MKKIFTILCLMALTMGAQAQPVIQEDATQRQHITAPGNLADGDVIMLQATEQTQKYFGGPNHTTDGTSDSYWQLVASGSSFKLVKFITTATGGTATYVKAPTAKGLDPIQTTTTESEAALFTLSTQATDYIPFTTKVNNTGDDTYLDCNSTYTTAKFATGTGGWSYWKVFKVSAEIKYPTEDQQAAFDKVGEWLGLIQSQALVTDASNYLSAHKQADEGTYAALLDKDNSTYFHSAWGGSSSGKSSDSGHDLQAKLPEATTSLYIYFVSRANGTGIPSAFRIDGSNNASDFTEDHTASTTWTQSVGQDNGSMPTGASQSYLSSKITLSDAYQYLRFVPTIYNNSGNNWFCLAEFWLLPSNEATDAAIAMMKSVTTAIELTDAQVQEINQIDTDLRNTVAKVTYVVEDESGNPLFTSDPQEVAKGTTITTLPAEFQRTAFYTYNSVNVTISNDQSITFTATLKEDAPVQFTADATNPIYYNLKIRGNYLVRQSDNTVPNQATSEPFNPAAAWAFIGTPYDGFSVINEQAGSDYTLMYSALYDANGNVFGRADIVTLRDDSGDKKWILETNTGGFVLRAKENTNVYLHQRSNNGLSTCAIVEWSAVHDDPGSTIIASTDKDALVELYNLLDAWEFGTGLNQYSEPADFANVMAAANTVITNDEIANFADTYQTLKALQASITLNMPQAGFYRIKGKTNSKYLAAGLAGNNKFNMSDAVDATTIFYYSGTKLINYSTGMENGMNASAWAWTLDGQGSEVTFEDGQTSGGYAIKSNNAYFYDGGTSADRGGSNDGNVRYNSWYLEEVPTLPITLRTTDNTNYFATFSAPVPVEINGATLCSVSSNSNKWIQYEEKPAATQLAAGTGVLLHATGSGEATIEATATILTETAETAGYGLQAYSAAFAVSDNTKLFLGKGKDSGKVGFYKLGSVSTNGFKAYFVNSTTGEAKEGFDLVNANETTGVESIDNAQFAIDNAPVYNLQGQRVVKAQKGVFIQNGKKIVVK